jgi:DNA-binding NarL/FixJ family response regulator
MRIDIVRELIERLIEATHRDGTLTEMAAREVERAFRQEYSGEAYYVKRLPVQMSDKQASITAAYLQGESTEDIASENGISRRTLYRYLKRDA